MTMKLKMLTAFALVAALSLSAVKAQNPKPFVIPELKEWKGAEGRLTLDADSRIFASGEAVKIAKQLSEDCEVLFGARLDVVTDGKPGQGDIVLAIQPQKKAKSSKQKAVNPESYTITIADKVEATAPTAQGLYWATRTMLQVAENSKDYSFPKGTINDCPDFPMRGFMIDCGRKYIPITYLQKLVKIMGYYKMNTLQVHLNDNGFPKYYDNNWDKTYAAFRMECAAYPGLAARDGYYTKEQFRDLQKLAVDCGVEIIPEIDAPAHSLAFTHYMPELANKKYGVDHLDITNPKSIELLDNLWREYLEGDDPVFMGPRVHIGTDEYNNSDKAVVEKFRALTDHLIKLVESYGKQACLWGSLTHARGETPIKVDNVLMWLWSNDYSRPDSMVALGYKSLSIPDGLTYIVPHAGYYYDYLNTRYLYEKWTPNIAGNNKYTFDYDDRRIIGGMFAVWNDICGNGISVKDIHHRLYPAMQTLSTKFWTGLSTTLPYDEFDKLRLTLSEAPGINELGTLPEKEINLGTVQPNKKNLGLGVVEAGYDYRVSFHLKTAKEERGTVLFSSPNAVFYLADPITGRMGYERDGYLSTFDFAPYEGEELDIAVEGDNKETRLYINGKLAETMNGRVFWSDGKSKQTMVETLVFPLQSTGNFRSAVSKLKVSKL